MPHTVLILELACRFQFARFCGHMEKSGQASATTALQTPIRRSQMGWLPRLWVAGSVLPYHVYILCQHMNSVGWGADSRQASAPEEASAEPRPYYWRVQQRLQARAEQDRSHLRSRSGLSQGICHPVMSMHDHSVYKLGSSHLRSKSGFQGVSGLFLGDAIC